jgi:hypothetical protein
MFQPGDVCVVNSKANKVLAGRYRSLIGKHVVIMEDKNVLDKYPIKVLDAEPENPWEFSIHLAMREDLLTKEW